MDFRKTLLFALGATLLTVGCGPGRESPDAGNDAGCVGACTTDGGEDAGVDPCAGVSKDGGSVTLEQLRAMKPCGQVVTVNNVVVHSVMKAEDGGSGASEAEFYVGSAGDAGPGIAVHKYFNDNPRDYTPQVGDLLKLTGFHYENYVTRNGQQHTQHRFGYRREVGGQFYADGGSGKLQVLFLDTERAVHTLEIENAAEFATDGGTGTPHDELRGARVHFPGPIHISDPAPTFMLRYNTDFTQAEGQQVFLEPSRDNFEGYVLDNGVVVADAFIRGKFEDLDGDDKKDPNEPLLCNFRHMAVDAGGGANQVVFPDGISGVWDSYTMVPFYTCAGNADYYTCTEPGYIPAADGGYLSDRINVIWPTSCDDLAGGMLVE